MTGCAADLRVRTGADDRGPRTRGLSVAWFESAPSRPTDHERPPDMAMVDGDQAANAWCHDGGLRSAFRVIRAGSLRTAHAAELRERTLANLRRPLSAALAV